MKKIILTVFTLSILLLGNTNQTHAQSDETCAVQSASFVLTQMASGGATPSKDFSETLPVKLEIDSTNCNGLKVKLYWVTESGALEVVPHTFPKLPEIIFPAAENTGAQGTVLKFETGESTVCDGNNADDGGGTWGWADCIIIAEVYDLNNNLVFSPRDNGNFSSSFVESTYNNNNSLERQSGILRGYCDGSCNDQPWKYKSILKGSIPNASLCTLGSGDIYFDYIDYQGVRGVLLGKKIRLNIKTKDKCAGIPLKVELWEQDGLDDNTIDFTTVDDDVILVTPPLDEDLYIDLLVNEDDCDGNSATNVWDCTIYTQVKKGATVIGLTEDKLGSSSGDSNAQYQSDQNFLNNTNFKKGVIVYECSVSGDCNNTGNDWKVIGTNAIDGNATEAAAFIPNNVIYDPNSPCYKPANEAEGTLEGYYQNCYEFLAPIPGIENDVNNTFDADRFIKTSDGRIAIRDINTYQFGDFFNKLFQLAIAILAVISVVMIVVAGVQYMTVESFYGKGEAKNRIIGAVGGLILALGIYTILHTINPQLLEVNFGGGFDEVSVRAEPGVELTANELALSVGVTPDSDSGKYLANSGVYCPLSGGQNIINQVATSFENKVTYRLGGKDFNLGKSLPSQYAGKDKNNACPTSTGTLCLDCSGFVNIVLKCSGVIKSQIGNGGTSGMFSLSNAIPINLNNSNLGQNSINGKPLQVGDMVGSSSNHVAIYVGGGKFMDSNGGGRALNSMVKKFTLTEPHVKKWAKKILRVSDIPAQYKK